MPKCLASPVHLAFDENNRPTFSTLYRVTVAENEGEPLSVVRAWAGRVGDAFRMPDSSGASYRELADVAVCAIDIVPGDDAFSFQVKFTALERRSANEMNTPLVGVSETVSRDGMRTKSAKFRFQSSFAASCLPEIGAPLDWAGAAFACESRSFTELPTGEYELTVTAREITSMQLGNTEYGEARDGEKTATARFFVGNAAYAEFTAALTLGSAALWAGARYYLTGWTESVCGRIGREIVCRAAKVETRLLQCLRSESFAGFDRSDAATREIVYRSVFLVHADDLAEFELLTGSAADWIDDDTIITSIVPTRVSPVEYRLEMEAKQVDSPSLAVECDNADDRSNLAGRVDVDGSLAEFLMTPEQCGFTPSDDGGFSAIPGFDFASNCPLAPAENVTESCINAPLSVVQLAETRYLRGSISHNLGKLLEFGESALYRGNVAGHPGSYRRIDIHAGELRDNRNFLYTRLTRVYQLAPAGFIWNPGYWN